MTYLVTLKPTGTFFFGGDTTFADASEQDAKARYFASSEYFPQQTQLLGMIKKALLNQNEHLKLRKRGEWIGKLDNAAYQEIVDLVGSQGFAIGANSKHGIIRSLSPVMLYDGSSFWIPAPKDHGLIYSPSNGESAFGVDDTNRFTVPMMSHYSAKEGIVPRLINERGEIKAYTDIFQDVEQVGIEKNQSGESNDDAFYRKKSYRFKSRELCFAFMLELDTAQSDLLFNSDVLLGGEQSHFVMEINAKGAIDPVSLFKGVAMPHEALYKCTLIGDALLDTQAYALCEYGITCKRSFRTLIANDASKPYTYKGKSDKIYLMESGSVLYLSKSAMEALSLELDNPAMRSIGYNHYIITPSSKENH